MRSEGFFWSVTIGLGVMSPLYLYSPLAQPQPPFRIVICATENHFAQAKDVFQASAVLRIQMGLLLPAFVVRGQTVEGRTADHLFRGFLLCFERIYHAG